jgi:hypothetical protein
MNKKKKKSFDFYLSEIFNGHEPELGYIIELMRAAGHLREVQRISLMIESPKSVSDMDRMIWDAEVESLRIFILNISAAQTREALKLFYDFSALPFYAELKNDFSEEQNITANILEKFVNEFSEKKGLLHNTLKPLRDRVFHYDERDASIWGKFILDNEKEVKPRHHNISIDKMGFGLGSEYDQYLFSKYLFWGEQDSGTPLQALAKLTHIDKCFLDFVVALSEVLMKRAGIPLNRRFDWVQPHRYGFKSQDGK